MVKKRSKNENIKKMLEESIKKQQDKKAKEEISKNKEENNKQEEKKEDKKENTSDEEESFLSSGFSERILSENIGFSAPVLNPDNAIESTTNLEQTAAEITTPANTTSDTRLNYSSRQDFDRSYSQVGGYESNKDASYRREDEIRTAPIIDTGARLSPIINPFSSAMGGTGRTFSNMEQRQREEFQRGQEQQRVEMEDSTSNPFKKSRKRQTEIF
jgi:hypothetical protein